MLILKPNQRMGKLQLPLTKWIYSEYGVEGWRNKQNLFFLNNFLTYYMYYELGILGQLDTLGSEYIMCLQSDRD